VHHSADTTLTTTAPTPQLARQRHFHYHHCHMRCDHHLDHQQEQHLAVSATEQHHHPNSNDVYTVVSHIHYTMDPFQSTQYNR
jgi:hypothetical protein